MPDIETVTVNDAKYHALSRAGDFELSIDATGSDGPTPNEVLVADYASCFSFACRAGANRQLDIDLGKIETEAEADLDDSDDLAAIRFHLHVEADLDADEVADVIELGEEICHVHAAVKESLQAEIEFTPDAF
jgi:uncharacterized OsmC-like protein